ncbi:MAG: hypothetical protein ACQETL_15725 [Bacteroidota bacterium]
MIKKISFILISGFLIQFLISCGRCEPSPTLQMVHTGLRLFPGMEIENRYQSYEDSVQKENFRLEIYLEHEEENFSDLNPFYSFGFNAAKAEDCPPPSYNYSDKVVDVSIIMLNQADTDKTLDVTNYFGSVVDSDTLDINDMIQMQYEYKSQFSIYLSLLEFEDIYQSAIFKVTATLESGTTFTEETEEIIFID